MNAIEKVIYDQCKVEYETALVASTYLAALADRFGLEREVSPDHFLFTSCDEVKDRMHFLNGRMQRLLASYDDEVKFMKSQADKE